MMDWHNSYDSKQESVNIAVSKYHELDANLNSNIHGLLMVIIIHNKPVYKSSN